MTLIEPWATLVAIGAKKNETRGQRTAHRGDMAIHAGLNQSGGSDEVTAAFLEAFRRRGEKPQINFGKIVAVVEIVDVQPSERFYRVPNCPSDPFHLSAEEAMFGNYAPGRFIYRTMNLRRLRVPVPCKGQQCVGFVLPPDVEAKVRAQL